MRSAFLIATKDLKLLLRDRMASFFVLGFPILMGVFFGLMMGGTSNETRSALRLAVIDQDESEISRGFVAILKDNANLAVEVDSVDSARDSVRRGQRIGMLVLPSGFGRTAGILWEDPPTIQLGMDPSRAAESAMVQGFIMEAIGQLVGKRFQNPKEFRPMIDEALARIETDESVGPIQRPLLRGIYQSLTNLMDSVEKLQDQPRDDGPGNENGAPSMQFADIQKIDVMRELDPKSVQAQVRKLRSRWDISFPQAMLWGVMGCVAGFAQSIAKERSQGTMLRLRVAPLTRFQLLSGKAMACFLATVVVIAMLTTLGVTLGMHPLSYPKLIVSAILVSFCFVGIMMTMSTLGKSEEAVGGIGWAVNMVMAMIGGCMIPVMFMPAFMQRLSIVSPVFWSIRTLEGAIWRDFSWRELMGPWLVLVFVGAVGLLVGTRIISREH